MKVFILIPVYNEEANLPLLRDNLTKTLDDCQKHYVFVDDCSSDNSVGLIHELFKDHEYHVITKEKNQGPGHSFNLGFEWIIENSSSEDIVVTMEADNTSDITILPNMVSISKLKFSLVLASVYAQGGGFEKTTLFRKILSLFANMIYRSLFNVKVLTLSSFYRVYHVSLLRKIKETETVIIKESGFICMLEILMKAIKNNATIIEVPMLLKSGNRIGNSKMKIFKTTKAYIKFLIKNL